MVNGRRTTILAAAALLLGLLALMAVPAAHGAVFVNEIHYDNTGTDSGEFIEVAGPAGFDLTGWSIVLYNGANGMSYDTDALMGSIPNQLNGFGTVSLSYAVNGIQNGDPDGIALVNAMGEVVQFLSYEGTFTAVGGPAGGMTSVNIGVFETGAEPAGLSLQFQDTGLWVGPIANTQNAPNTGQLFVGATVPEPSTVLLLGSGLAALAATTWKKRGAPSHGA